LRWRDPVPAKPWTGAYQALTFGAACPQFASIIAGVEGKAGEAVGNEDCLFLNVYSPPIVANAIPRDADRLPVMVWIHGGGNSVGTTTMYEGGNLAVTQNVIVVTIQYRLGPLGWFRHAALRDSARTDTERSGNFGTLDTITALRWVHDNIAAFGGDPGRVTIFGESAGARNVYSLLISPLAKGLFQGGIAESGGVYCSSAAEAENLTDAPEQGSRRSSAEIMLALIQKDFHLDRDAAKAKMAAMSTSETSAYLRSKTAKEILESSIPKRLAIYPQLFDDGAVIAKGGWRNLGHSDVWNRVPFITGTNRDEGRLFLFGDPRFFKMECGIIPRFTNEKLYLKVADYLTRFAKLAGVDQPAAAMQALEPKVFVYRFDWDEEPTILGADLSKMLGAAHAMEIPFVFGHFNLGSRLGNKLFSAQTRASRLALAQAVMSYWGEFAHHGDPGRGTHHDQAAWSPYDATKHQIILDTPEGGGVRLDTNRDTEAAIMADLFSDPALSPAARCEMLQSRVFMGWDYTAADYAKREECRAVPFVIRSDL
jgi:para-nitrobenzyl esterase